MNQIQNKEEMEKNLTKVTHETIDVLFKKFDYFTPNMYSVIFNKKSEELNITFDEILLENNINEKLLDLLNKETQLSESATELKAITSKAIVGIKTKNQDYLDTLLKEMQNIANKFNETLKEFHIDDLTGLLNKKGLLAHLLEKTKMPFEGSLFVFDLDNLKIVNDVHGHLIGDILIKGFASQGLLKFASNIPLDNKIICRLGGDEFVVLIEKTNSVYFDQTIKNFIKLPRKLKISEDILINFDFSFGKKDFKKGDNFDDIFKLADEEMYNSKKSKKSVVNKK